VVAPLFKQIARCLNSSHFQVRLAILAHTAASVIAFCEDRHRTLSLMCTTTFPSPGPQVAERSLFLWNNEAVVGLVAQHRGAVVPAVLPALEKNARSHWNPAVHGLTVNVRKMFQEMDAQLYEQCRQRFEHEEVRLPLCLLASGAVMASRAQSAGR
jgi:Protein phosphatase 2A regulatory B subunit (B56 family)